MPSKNIIREYSEGNFYHIYNRGVEKRSIFMSDKDYKVMLNMLARHLRPENETDLYGREYVNYSESVDLLAYCLMPNHFHLLVYLKQKEGAVQLMQSVMTAYVKYFNEEYDRVGGLFQSRYKASRIDSESYLWHISRYIHLNPRNWRKYEYSSLANYLDGKQSSWINTDRVKAMNKENGVNYINFLRDYEDFKANSLSTIAD